MTEASAKFATRHFLLDADREKLSDDLVGQVLPRAPEARDVTGAVGGMLLDKMLLSNAAQYTKKPKSGLTLPFLIDDSTSASGTASTTQPKLRHTNKKVTRKRLGMSRQEQCRINQARYRSRQRTYEQQVELKVKQLRLEIEHLKRMHGDVTRDAKSQPSPWAVVAEVFRLFESSMHSPWSKKGAGRVISTETPKKCWFLRESFPPRVTTGDLLGFDACMEQIQRWRKNFGSPELSLQRIEPVTTGVMLATARLRATVTEHTLRNVFPNVSRRSDKERMKSRLLNQRLECRCSVTFFFDENSGRVGRLEMNVDFMGRLLQSLRRLEDVALALSPSTLDLQPLDGKAPIATTNSV